MDFSFVIFQINKEDDLPKVVCIECENRLNSIIDLRSMCKKNQKVSAFLGLFRGFFFVHL